MGPARTFPPPFTGEVSAAEERLTEGAATARPVTRPLHHPLSGGRSPSPASRGRK